MIRDDQLDGASAVKRFFRFSGESAILCAVGGNRAVRMDRRVGSEENEGHHGGGQTVARDSQQGNTRIRAEPYSVKRKTNTNFLIV